MNNIAIFGAPRSGTSWLGQLFNSSPVTMYRFQPLFSYAFKNWLDGNSNAEDITHFYQELEQTKDDFVLQNTNISGKKTDYAFDKESPSHLIWKEVRYHHLIERIIQYSNTKIIGIVRHPCAVINSWVNAPKEFKAEWNILDEWRWAEKKNQGKVEEYNGYQKWKELAFLYLNLSKKYPNQFKVVLYEELNNNATDVMKGLFSYCHIPWNQQTEGFIYKSQHTQQNDAYSVFRANQDDQSWKNSLHPVIQSEILEDEEYKVLNDSFQWNI